jgi:hypothetical protein
LHGDGNDSSSERQSRPSCEKMLDAASRCAEGSASSVTPCVEPEVIAM